MEGGIDLDALLLEHLRQRAPQLSEEVLRAALATPSPTAERVQTGLERLLSGAKNSNPPSPVSPPPTWVNSERIKKGPRAEPVKLPPATDTAVLTAGCAAAAGGGGSAHTAGALPGLSVPDPAQKSGGALGLSPRGPAPRFYNPAFDARVPEEWDDDDDLGYVRVSADDRAGLLRARMHIRVASQHRRGLLPFNESAMMPVLPAMPRGAAGYPGDDMQRREAEMEAQLSPFFAEKDSRETTLFRTGLDAPEISTASVITDSAYSTNYEKKSSDDEFKILDEKLTIGGDATRPSAGGECDTGLSDDSPGLSAEEAMIAQLASMGVDEYLPDQESGESPARAAAVSASVNAQMLSVEEAQAAALALAATSKYADATDRAGGEGGKGGGEVLASDAWRALGAPLAPVVVVEDAVGGAAAKSVPEMSPTAGAAAAAAGGIEVRRSSAVGPSDVASWLLAGLGTLPGLGLPLAFGGSAVAPAASDVRPTAQAVGESGGVARESGSQQDSGGESGANETHGAWPGERVGHHNGFESLSPNAAGRGNEGKGGHEEEGDGRRYGDGSRRRANANAHTQPYGRRDARDKEDDDDATEDEGEGEDEGEEYTSSRDEEGEDSQEEDESEEDIGSDEERSDEGQSEEGSERARVEVEDDLDPLEQRARDLQLLDFFNLKVIFRKDRTGFEEEKEFPVRINSVIAGRYQLVEYLGSAAFSKAVQCYDMEADRMVCIKIIKNNKDFFDQSMDEIKLLQLLNNADPLQLQPVLRLFDFFYHKEHLFIVCELLRDNLYEASKFNRESTNPRYFTLRRLRSCAKQCLEAMKFIHGLGLIHCDLKPENILIKSYSRCEIKIIDFGSSCFTTDHLSSYVQSRSYRAPEVILGMPYDQRIDIWSLGCIIAELWTGYTHTHTHWDGIRVLCTGTLIRVFSQHLGPVEICQGTDVPLDMYT